VKRLTRLKPKVGINKDFYVFDVETTPFKTGEKPEFIFGVLYTWYSYKVIHSIEDFQTEFLKPEYKNKLIFAHNAEFDLNVIYGNIYKLDPEAIFNGKFITATNGNCKFADSMSIYVGYSVKRLGEMLGLVKLDIDYQTMAATKEAIEYCLRDCEIVYKALLFFFETVGDIKITQASLSMSFFRRNYLKHDIEHNEHNLEFFKSYYGGRTEAFKIGKVNAVVYDYNSMYTQAMKEVIVPNPKTIKHTTKISPSLFIRHFLKNFEGMAFCKVEHKELPFGFLPHRLTLDNGFKKLVFPTGTFSGYWNFNELRFALENNAIEIKEIYDVFSGVKMESPMRDFAIDLYKKRFETKDAMLIDVWKRLSNSLYGKFAQKIDSDLMYVDNIENYLDFIQELRLQNKYVKIITFSTERKDAFIEYKKDKAFDIQYCIPSFASYITSFSRVMLLESIIKYQDYEPVYCDTDSIFFNLRPPIESSKELGQLKREEKIVTEIRGLKNYSFEKITDPNHITINRIKGVPAKAINVHGKVYEYSTIVKSKESLRRKIDTGVQLIRVKEIKGKYDKRIVYENGETKPIHILK